MILHLLSEPNFFSMMVEQFEKINLNNNIYVVFKDSNYEQLTAITDKSHIINYKTESDIEHIKITGVISHFLTYTKAKFILSLDENIPVLWSCYGYDLYKFYPRLKRNLYGKITKGVINRNKKMPAVYYDLFDIKEFYFSSEKKLIRKAIDRIQFISTVLPNEFLLFPGRIRKKAKYLHIQAGIGDLSNEETNEYTRPGNFCAANVYIGNSADPSCNHLEVLDFLRNKGMSDKIKLTLQMCYGGSESYNKLVASSYNTVFKDNVLVQTEFLNSTAFNENLQSHNVFIFNNHRQQGMGAVFQALWQGGKVFLSTKNPAYSYFISNKVIVYSLEKDFLNLSSDEILEPLNYTEIVHNRNFFLNYYSPEKRIERAVTALNALKTFNTQVH